MALDVCRHAYRHGDVETLKRGLETLCIVYGVDPAELSRQGLGQSVSPARCMCGKSSASASVETDASTNSLTLAPTMPERDAPIDVADTVEALLDDLDELVHKS